MLGVNLGVMKGNVKMGTVACVDVVVGSGETEDDVWGTKGEEVGGGADVVAVNLGVMFGNVMIPRVVCVDTVVGACDDVEDIEVAEVLVVVDGVWGTIDAVVDGVVVLVVKLDTVDVDAVVDAVVGDCDDELCGAKDVVGIL